MGAMVVIRVQPDREQAMPLPVGVKRWLYAQSSSRGGGEALHVAVDLRAVTWASPLFVEMYEPAGPNVDLRPIGDAAL
jgi:hypothetical protein